MSSSEIDPLLSGDSSSTRAPPPTAHEASASAAGGLPEGVPPPNDEFGATKKPRTSKLGGVEGNGNFVEEILDQMAQNASPTLQPYIKKAKPFLVSAANAVDAAFPYVQKGYDVLMQAYKVVEPYGPEQYFPLIFGLFLLFFGGAYMMLVAAIEAMRMTVWESLKKSILVLYNNYGTARIAFKKDDELDEDGNGIADVLERTAKENLSRRVYIFFRSVRPEEVTDALVQVWSSVLTIVGTVRVKMAQCITFGVALGETIYKPLQPTFEPAVKNALPKDLKHWATASGCKKIFAFVGVCLAYVFQRVITAFHSATRGATLVVAAGIRLAKKRGMNPPFEEDDRNASLFVWLLAAIGFYWQWSSGFSVIFPLNIVLLPFTIIENFLSFALAVGLGI